jgi:hypothetical protein
MQNGHCVRYVNVPLGQWNGLRSEDEDQWEAAIPRQTGAVEAVM